MTTKKRKSVIDNSQIIRDQVSTQDFIDGIRQQRRTIDEIAFYPKHDKRKETAEYKKVHDKLCKELDLPCLVCGVKNSTLKKPAENPYGAVQMETHHHVVEWALANAIDTERFNKILRPHLKMRHPDALYKKDMNEKDIHDWVDHSPHNLWVLCDVHHRHKYLGIHAITYPIWGPQDLFGESFSGFVRKALKTTATKTKPAKTKKTK